MTDLPQTPKHLSEFEWINKEGDRRGRQKEAKRKFQGWAEKGIFAACFVGTHRGQSYITGQREHQVAMHCSD